jgi:hypothetical protein
MSLSEAIFGGQTTNITVQLKSAMLKFFFKKPMMGCDIFPYL